MLLKPFSTRSGIAYKDFLRQNYFCSVSGRGLKKINLKGINKIGASSGNDFKEYSENEIFQRKIEDLKLTEVLINDDEKAQVSEITKPRLEAIGEKAISFSELGAVFTFEMIDIVYCSNILYGELTHGLDIIKDSMIFAEKPKSFERFIATAEKYARYLENPSEYSLFIECKTEFELCIKDYDSNPYDHFFLGLIFHRPTSFFDPERSIEEFIKAGELSKEIEDHYMTALCNFIVSWLKYVNKDLQSAIGLLIEATDEEFMNIPEIYYNLSKFYAADGDSERSLTYLEEAIERFDYFYAIKADMDDDFSVIRKDLSLFFEKLRDEERSKIISRLNEYGVSIGQNKLSKAGK
jgi:tetratricopeptide (TPR) repeat protein